MGSARFGEHMCDLGMNEGLTLHVGRREWGTDIARIPDKLESGLLVLYGYNAVVAYLLGYSLCSRVRCFFHHCGAAHVPYIYPHNIVHLRTT